MPELPTIASAGLPGYESAATIGLFTRAGTPPAVVDVLQRETEPVYFVHFGRGVPELGVGHLDLAEHHTHDFTQPRRQGG
jgi:hypothetical protein